METKAATTASELNLDGPTPDYLQPKMGEGGQGEPAYYRSLFILDTIEPGCGQLEELKAPVDPLDEAFDEDKLPEGAELKPAFGLLTVHEQVWNQVGIGLGNLLQSICLAPGEVTQVAVTRWQHKTAGSSTETTVQSETARDQAEQHRAVNEVQRAVANEAQWGTSSALSTSSSAQAGAAFLFGSASAASTTTTSLTAQFSAGTRNLAAESTHAIDQTTAEVSQALRSRRQSVVREVVEEEDESLSTRILANYNRRHTLNILFFEVLQLYEIKTALAGWERCLFVPMVPMDFNNEKTVSKYRARLLHILKEFKADEMIALLDQALEPQKPAAPAASPPGTGAQASGKLTELRKAKQLLVELLEVKHRMELHFHANRLSTFRVDEQEYCAMVDRYRSLAVNCPEIPHIDDITVMDIKSPSTGAILKRGEKMTLAHHTPAPEAMDPLIERELLTQAAQSKVPAREQLNLHRLFLSQQLWLRMSPYRIYRILKNYQVQGQPLCSLVDPQPVGVFGNYLAFRWGFPGTPEGRASRETFEKTYVEPARKEVKRTLGLPTSGVFAEGVLGHGIAAEPRNKQFPKWGEPDNQIPILPPKIADLQSRDRAQGMDLKAQDFASSLAQLRAEKLSDASYLEKILGQIGKGDMFRDMGGLAQAVGLAEKLGSLSSEAATKAGDRAVELQKKVLDTFEKVIESEVGQAAVAEFMLPGSGATLLGAKKGDATSAPKAEKPAATPKSDKPAAAPKK